MRAGVALAALSLSGCAGGGPVGHPAHPLAAGDVSLAAGASAQLAEGGAASSIRDARESTVAGAVPPPDADARYRRGAVSQVAVGPGLAPFVAARVGLAGSHEAGISWTGRRLRFDARHAFVWDRVALSVGGGAHASRGRVGEDKDQPIAGLGTEGATSGGLDVPVLLGYRSGAGILSLWGGARVGYERLGGTLCRGTPSDCERQDLRGGHWSAGGLVGLSVGFRRVHVLLELDAAYERVDAQWGGAQAKIDGWSLGPAAMVSFRF